MSLDLAKLLNRVWAFLRGVTPETRPGLFNLIP
jgi:hypothetical protein